jgi:hypothetical protein
MLRAGFEPATPATKRPQTYALDSTATGIGKISLTAGTMKWTVCVKKGDDLDLGTM